MTTTFTTPTLLAATAGLIAFHIGVLTLVGRERKAPYVINRVFTIFILALLVAAVGSAAAIVADPVRTLLLWLGGLMFVVAILVSVVQVYRIMARFAYFEDSLHPKYWTIVRKVQRRSAAGQLKPTYHTNALEIDKELGEALMATLRRVGAMNAAGGDEQELRSLAIVVDRLSQSNAILVDLSVAFLRSGCSVQYMTASRHPVELVDALVDATKTAGLDFATLAQRIVVVDAYSTHFAFKDKIYWKKADELTRRNVTFLASRMTYAGIHTTSSRAFKTIRAQTGQKDVRSPTLVIYEGAYALADLESSEQYRTFVRHVIPSERYWNGMFTVFAECALPEIDWQLLCGYSSLTLDLRQARTAQPTVPTGSGAP